MTIRRMSLVLVLAWAAAGCGGSDGSDDGPEDAVRTYLEAVADADGEKACDQLTSDVQRQAVDFLAAQGPQFRAASCEEGFEKLAATLGEDEKDILRDPGDATVEVNDDTATVRFEKATTAAELTKNGDGWLISGGLFD